jgi:hypothetical protein
MKLLAESEILPHFLTEPIYVLDEIIPETIVPRQLFTSEVLFLIPCKDSDLAPGSAEQLQKILKWLDLKEKDIMSAGDILEGGFFPNEKTKKCISFGVDLNIFDNEIQAEKYRAKFYKDILFVLSDDLATITTDTVSKRQLFTVLKEVFER